VGGPIITKATTEALETGEHRVLANREDIGCPKADCLLKAAIVVPLEVRDEPVGTLKFYYTTRNLLNETQIALAEGLARLLSTQLELAELDRQTELAQRMQLKALQAQINPHFLFNTLNTIAAFIRTEPDEARILVREFAAFYRRTLEDDPDKLITVERELDYVNTYVSLEKARFGDNLIFVEDVDDDVLALALPPFVVQPVVENAIGHGMKAGLPLTVRVTSAWRDGLLVLCVSDDGQGIAPEKTARILEPGQSTGLGIALRNIDDRLKGHFGARSGLEVRSEPGKGTDVDLIIDVGSATGEV
jgi:two-component system sensor histidine kinase LytS